MEKDKILEYLKNTDLTSLEEPLKILAEKIHSYRKKNNFYVPLNVFPHCLAIGGISAVVELLIECFDDGKFKGYLLKKRNSKENGWENLYHTPGTVIRKGDSPEKIFERLKKEIWGENKEKYLKRPIYFGTEIHYEKRRKVMRTGRLYISKIDYKDIKSLNGNWKIFKGDEKERREAGNLKKQEFFFVPFEHLKDLIYNQGRLSKINPEGYLPEDPRKIPLLDESTIGLIYSYKKLTGEKLDIKETIDRLKRDGLEIKVYDTSPGKVYEFPTKF